MADRKKSPKKKHTKKIKKSAKKDEKHKEKYKDKDKGKDMHLFSSYSEHNLPRRRSAQIEIQKLYEPEKRAESDEPEAKKSVEFTHEQIEGNVDDDDSSGNSDKEFNKKKSEKFSQHKIDSKVLLNKEPSRRETELVDSIDNLNKRKSKELSRRQLNDSIPNDPTKRKSMEFSRNIAVELSRSKSRELSRRQFDYDEPSKRKSRELSRRHFDNDEPSTRKSREFDYDEPSKRKSRELSRRHFDNDEPSTRKSREFSRRKLDDFSPDEPIKKKSIEFSRHVRSEDYIKGDPIRRKSRELSQFREFNIDEPTKRKSSHKQIDVYPKKSRDEFENKLHKRGGESKTSGDFYKKYKNMRNSRVSLSGIYTTADREEAGEQSKVMVVPNNNLENRPSKYAFVEPPDTSRTHLKFAIIWMEICGITHLSLMFAYGFAENFLSIQNYDENTGENTNLLSHYFYGSLWIFICGNAMTLFRIFNRTRTRSIKYFHLTLNTVAFAAALLSIYAFHLHWKGIDIEKHNYSLHAKMGVIAVVSYCFQWLIGLCVYSMTMFRQKFRIQFYHYHSYIGFVVFFMTITTMCSGLVMEEKFAELGYSSNRYTCTWLPRATGITGVIFSGAVLFIIVYPYFDFAKETEQI